MSFHRRNFLGFTPLLLIRPAFGQSSSPLPPGFPTTPADLAQEMVGASHANLTRVKELLKIHPSLAKASTDWGFGDWETALGAASHTGNRPIAELLLEHGAPPTLYSATMLGQLEVVRGVIAGQPGVQRLAGPHSISLLAHARVGGEKAKPVYDYLMSLGDADEPTEQPITEAQLKEILGTYRFGPAENDRVEIRLNSMKRPMFERAGRPAHRMFHLGKLAFHPVGVPSVRILFAENGSLTVHDPEPILTARRSAAGQG